VPVPIEHHNLVVCHTSPAVYITDHEIKTMLDELGLEEQDQDPAFIAADQVQPCSIDLRLSSVFWKRSRRRQIWRLLTRRGDYAVDLRRSQAQAIEPLRDGKRRDLEEGDTITIKPGQVVMGRIHERFKIPSGYAGKIEGRSSFARLGLAVHCTGDFINPGWEGYMPLQLFNAGPYPIRITPHLPVCQLMLIRLPSEPARTYGDPELQSKYINDDGGPSLWWRDRHIRELQRRLGETHVSERIQREIVEVAEVTDPAVIERLQDFIDDRPAGKLSNAGDLLEEFAEKEERRWLVDWAAVGAFPILAAGTLSAIFVPFGLLHFLLLALLVVDLVLGWRGFVRRDGGYLRRKDLHKKTVRDPRDD
jgi:deoxycytidine triphosphate deaminase